MLDDEKKDEILSEFEKKIRGLGSELVNSPESIHLRLLNICSSFSSELTAKEMSEVLFSVNHNLYDAHKNKNGDKDKDPNSDVSIEDSKINIDLSDLDAESSDEKNKNPLKELIELLNPEQLKKLLDNLKGAEDSVLKNLPIDGLIELLSTNSDLRKENSPENIAGESQHDPRSSQPSQSR